MLRVRAFFNKSLLTGKLAAFWGAAILYRLAVGASGCSCGWSSIIDKRNEL